MTRVLRVAVAAIAAILLVGMASLPVTTSQVQVHPQIADPSWPDGG